MVEKSLSVITVNRNNKYGLINTVSSLMGQVFDQWSQFIVDSASSDLEIDFWSKITKDNINFISEKDAGVYDGMNKGVSLTSGDYLFFLNSGDRLIESDSLQNLTSHMGEFDLIYGDVIFENDSDLKIFSYPDDLSLEYMICYGLPHQAILIKRELHERIGGYSTDYKIISDWVFFMESLFYSQATYIHVPKSITFFDAKGMSQQAVNFSLIISEQLDYISKRFPAYISFYKQNSPYVKKYFLRIPRWKRPLSRLMFHLFNRL